METLQRYLANIRNQLVGLTMSQKLLIASLLVIMVGIVFGVVYVSAKPVMTDLLPGSWSPEDMALVKSHLDGRHSYEIVGDKIMVPAEEAFAIRGELAAEQALPKDTTRAFALLAQANPFLNSDAQNDRLWNLAKQEVLSKVIRNFPYISDATVIISKGEPIGLGHAGVPSSAMVTIKTRSGEPLNSGQLLAIVETVHGANSGMRREDVRVTDGARAYHVPSDDQPTPTDLLEAKKKMEDALTSKLIDQLSYIPGAKVSVNVIIDMSSRKTQSKLYEGKPVKADTNSTSHETISSDTPAGGQPGVQPNVALSAGSGGATHGNAQNSTETTTTTEVRFPEQTEEKILPAGTEIKEMTASISLPRSYFERIYKLRVAKDPKIDPDDTMLKPIITAKIESVRSQAKNTIGAKTDEQISIDYFDDTISAQPLLAGMAGTGSTGTISTLVSLYAKQGILAVMAMGALGMMLMMVRRAVPAGAGDDLNPGAFTSGSATPRRKKGEGGAMDVGDDVYGEANEGEAVLTGIELDDETLKSRKMVEEVSTMIKENPESAATLVKRWMTKGK